MAAARPRLALLIAEYGYFLSHRLALAVAAVDAGWDVTVLTRVPPGTVPGTWPGITVVDVALPRGMGRPLDDLAAVRRLTAELRARRPDLLHTVSVKLALLGMLAAWRAGVPRVLNAYTGLGALFHGTGAAVSVLRALGVPVLRLLTRRTGAHVLCQNAADRDTLLALGLADPARTTVVGGAGVDPDAFTPVPEPEGAPCVVFVGRLLLDKGLAEFVSAATALARRGSAARFLAAGEPDPQNPRSVPAATLAAWRREAPVEWLGHVADMPALLARCHIVCLPSYHEGVPKALLEAAAAGRPVVASDIAGCRVAVEPGGNGLLVPPRDATALADALATLIGDPALRQRFGAHGRHLAETRFAARLLNGQVINLYRRMRGP